MNINRKKKILFFIVGILLGYFIGVFQKMKKINDQANRWKRESNKFEQTLLMTVKWLKIKIENRKLEDYFLKNNYYKIAIYGMNYLGVRLYEDLAMSSVNVLYGIDKYTSSADVDIPVYSLDSPLCEVDAIVVTPIYYYEEIKRDLSGKVKVPIISLNDILFEI